MKKTFILCLAVLVTAVFNNSFGEHATSGAAGDPERLTTLVVNANVTVVLVDSDKPTAELVGHGSFTDLITLKRMGDTLVIESAKKKNLKDNGIVFVPAMHLKNIQINSAALVRSLTILQLPQLDVVINGDCKVNIANIGQLNLHGTDDYSYDQLIEVVQLPSKMLRRK